MWFVHSFYFKDNRDFFGRDSDKSKIVKHDFHKKDTVFYDYEHKNLVVCVMVSESLNFLLSGGLQEKTVLSDLTSGKTLKILDSAVRLDCCFANFGALVAFGMKRSVGFLDLETQEIIPITSITSRCQEISCMVLYWKEDKSRKSRDLCLFVGGNKSECKFDWISLPQEIQSRVSKYSKTN